MSAPCTMAIAAMGWASAATLRQRKMVQWARSRRDRDVIRPGAEGVGESERLLRADLGEYAGIGGRAEEGRDTRRPAEAPDSDPMGATSDPGAGLALVTGASSGIGEAFARRLAADGWSLIIVARRGERLRALASELEQRHGARTEVVVADLTRRAGLAAVNEALAGRAIGRAVLNAGFGSTGELAAADPGRQADMVRLNCVAVTDLAARVLPDMVARGRGDLVVVSSAAAFQPIPFMATYAATKAFEVQLVRALSAELRGSGVRALAVCPGPVNTEFGRAMGGSGLDPRIPHNTAEQVVDATLLALSRRRATVTVGGLARLASAARVVPVGARAALVGRVHRALRRGRAGRDRGR